ncbi:MAG: sigma factor-like helix-turn-helix DNA-binding protein [Sediminibacterium sp.]
MSRKVLSEREYDILQKLLIEKMSLQEVAGIYGITGEGVRQIYERTYKKVKSVTELLGEIDEYKHKLQQLKHDFTCEIKQTKRKEDKDKVDLHKKLTASHFPFSKRLYNMMELLDIHTIGQLVAIPLKSFECFRGFKEKCKKELIAFIEFENIEHLFEDFSLWKTQPIRNKQ